MSDPSTPTAIDGTRPAPSLSDAERLLTEARDPLLGQVIQDRYLIVRKLGEGGMGRVYEAEHTVVKRRIAIKCLHAQYASNSDVLGRFLREAQAAGSIGNEHVVDVLDMGRMADGAPFMALEYLDGRDLADVLRADGPMPIGRAVRIMQQVCSAVGAAHEKGIVHRDLKPENVFLIARGTNTDFVKVLDFGIAKFLTGEGGGSRTGTGVMVGTPEYMSPEQIEDTKSVDHRSDLYALGVILYTALAGRPPFRTESVAKLAYEVCTLPPPPLRGVRPDVPEALASAVEQLLAKTPDARIQSAREVSERLSPFAALDAAPVAGSTTLPARSSAIAPPVTAPAATRRWPLAVTAVAISLVVAAGVAWRSQSRPAPRPMLTPSPTVIAAPPAFAEPPPIVEAAVAPPPAALPPVAPTTEPAPITAADEPTGHRHGRHRRDPPATASATTSLARPAAPAAPAPAAPSEPRPAPVPPASHGRLLDINLDPH
jgi:serine/threonine-protein kinase